MAITNGYAELDDLRKWLTKDAGTAEDDMLENVITSVSRWIDKYCDRHFWQTDADTTRVFDTCHLHLLELGAFNDLVAVTAVKTDEGRDGTFETTWLASEYQPLPLNPSAASEAQPYREIRAINRTFPVRYATDREGLIQVTGTWGWPAVPTAVHEACLLQSSRVFKRRYSPEGIAGYSEFGIVRVSGKLDSDVEMMLNPYRRMAVLVA